MMMATPLPGNIQVITRFPFKTYIAGQCFNFVLSFEFEKFIRNIEGKVKSSLVS
jgi:hypothetical protein